jgi:hypothetical protein
MANGKNTATHQSQQTLPSQTLLALQTGCGRRAQGPRPLAYSMGDGRSSAPNLLRRWAPGPASRCSRGRCPRARHRPAHTPMPTRQRPHANARTPTPTRQRDGRACPDSSQQVWRARHRERRRTHANATVGLVPTRRNRFGALESANAAARTPTRRSGLPRLVAIGLVR